MIVKEWLARQAIHELQNLNTVQKKAMNEGEIGTKDIYTYRNEAHGRARFNYKGQKHQLNE